MNNSSPKSSSPQELIHGCQGLVPALTSEGFLPVEAGEGFAYYLHGGVGLGRELGGCRASTLFLIELHKATVDGRFGLRAVGLGNQQTVAIALAHRIDVRGIHAVSRCN